jgi:hypothetical protein
MRFTAGYWRPMSRACCCFIRDRRSRCSKTPWLQVGAKRCPGCPDHPALRALTRRRCVLLSPAKKATATREQNLCHKMRLCQIRSRDEITDSPGVTRLSLHVMAAAAACVKTRFRRSLVENISPDAWLGADISQYQVRMPLKETDILLGISEGSFHTGWQAGHPRLC